MQSQNRRKNISRPVILRLLLMLLIIGFIQIPSARPQANMQEAKAIAAYSLTMDHVIRQFQVATDLTRDHQLKAQFAGLHDLGLEERIQKIESIPELASATRARGISARDLIMTSAALGPAIAIAGLIDTGERGPGESEQNKVFWAAAPPDHIKFYRDHKAEIDKLVADMMQSGKERAH